MIKDWLGLGVEFYLYILISVAIFSFPFLQYQIDEENRKTNKQGKNKQKPVSCTQPTFGSITDA